MSEAMGISHQKLGRWLREGEEAVIDPVNGDILRGAGVKEIPADHFTVSGINQIFHEHKRNSKKRAKAEGLPFNEDYPTYQFTKPRKDGKQGDRVFILATNFIDKQTRNRIIQGNGQSHRFYALIGRSTINLYKYNTQADIRNIEDPPSTETEREYRNNVGMEFDALLTANVKRLPIYTRKVRLGPVSQTKWAHPQDYLSEFNSAIAQKHEPATGESGTALVDELIFQLIPRSFNVAESSPRNTRRSKKTR